MASPKATNDGAAQIIWAAPSGLGVVAVLGELLGVGGQGRRFASPEGLGPGQITSCSARSISTTSCRSIRTKPHLGSSLTARHIDGLAGGYRLVSCLFAAGSMERGVSECSISIRRGLAFSAIGMVTDSTPLS